MVKLIVPVPVSDLPFRVHGMNMKYVVTFSDGSEYVAFGILYSVAQMFNSLQNRLRMDSNIEAVSVYCPNGVGICCCYRC